MPRAPAWADGPGRGAGQKRTPARRHPRKRGERRRRAGLGGL